MRMPGPLPIVCRFENDNGHSRMSFRCACGESVAAYVTAVSGGVEAQCPKCRLFVQLRASKEYAAEGGKPGSGRGAF